MRVGQDPEGLVVALALGSVFVVERPGAGPGLEGAERPLVTGVGQVAVGDVPGQHRPFSCPTPG